MSLENYVENLLLTHSNERTCRFEYEGKFYWLKQPEQVKGALRLLKPFPLKAFRQESECLQRLNALNAPVPKVYLATDRALVLEDCGPTVTQLFSQPGFPLEDKQRILQDCVQALIQLHKMGITHGRPVLKDTLWQDGVVRFIDFEVHSKSNNLHWKKVRDVLLFIYGLCREQCVTSALLQHTLQIYAQQGEQSVWQAVVKWINAVRPIYYLLLLFKPIAGGDLKAFYGVVEGVTKYQASLKS